MSRRNHKHPPKPGMSHPIPLKVPLDMQAAIKRVAHASTLSEADIMRLAIERGLAVVEKMFEKPAAQAA